MERVEIIYCPRVLVSTLRGRFDYVMLRFCGLLLDFVGDCIKLFNPPDDVGGGVV